MFVQRVDDPAALGFPDVNPAIPIRRREELAVWAEANGRHPVRMFLNRANELTVRCGVDFRKARRGADREPLVIGGKVRGQDHVVLVT